MTKQTKKKKLKDKKKYSRFFNMYMCAVNFNIDYYFKNWYKMT